ncbi:MULTISPECIES: hypothetical protein [Aestuariimicrobium]|uniref:hypothetical protein n=1 Tax=Aestuariimicrobium TaxID=396388 RepID=UPI0003B4931C|nr:MULTISPECIES: hypothetical protein [Aestuariimicrobium]CAI9405679.1 hypothetical protein AESSP_01463 [Aestuariimicrobium sp. T2.26MG-19.2B]
MNAFDDLFGALDSHLAWVRGLDPRGPDAERNGRKHFIFATESPTSAWAIYYCHQCLTQTMNSGSWMFAADAEQALRPPTDAGLTTVRGLSPSAELDAELADWQRRHAVAAKPYPGEAPRIN